MTKVREIVRFDDAENAFGDVPVFRGTPLGNEGTLPVTSRTSVGDAWIDPQLPNGAISGWMYLNLDNCTCDSPWASSSWVVTSMRAEGRYSVEMDAAAMGNGCSYESPVSEVTTGSWIIQPAPNR